MQIQIFTIPVVNSKQEIEELNLLYAYTKALTAQSCEIVVVFSINALLAFKTMLFGIHR